VLKAHPLGSPAMTVDSCWTERLSTSDFAVVRQVDVLPLPEVPPPPLLPVPLPVPPVLPEVETLDPEPPVGALSPFSRRVHDEAITATSPRTTKGAQAARYRLRRVTKLCWCMMRSSPGAPTLGGFLLPCPRNGRSQEGLVRERGRTIAQANGRCLQHPACVIEVTVQLAFHRYSINQSSAADPNECPLRIATRRVTCARNGRTRPSPLAFARSYAPASVFMPVGGVFLYYRRAGAR
jgi:hypothetical protein